MPATAMPAPQPRHHRATIALHWITLAAIAVGLLAVSGHELSSDKTTRGWLLELHRNAGLLIFCATIARLLLRSTLGIGEVNRASSSGQRLLSSLSHFLLYALLVSIPMIGWLLTNAHGRTPQLFGLLPLPVLVEPDRELADELLSIHGSLSWALLALTAAHAAAALWHHYGQGDGVLRSILPAWLARRLAVRNSTFANPS